MSIFNFDSHPAIFDWLRPTLAVVALVIALDTLMWGSLGPWTQIKSALGDCEVECTVIRQRIDAEIELARARRSETDQWRALIVGSSRADYGFLPDIFPQDDRAIAVLDLYKVAIPSLEPYAMRSLASRLRSDDVDEVVLYLSEFDTHRTPYLVPSVGFGGIAGFALFLRLADPDLLWHHREGLRRLAVAATLNTYRNRDIIQALTRRTATKTGHDNEANDEAPRDFGTFVNALAIKPPIESIMPWDDFLMLSEEIQARLPKEVASGQFGQVRTICPGKHVELQQTFVISTIETLLEKGIRVSIVEPPINPLAELFYDLQLRDNFRQFAERQALDARVDFLGLEDVPPFQEDEFRDLTHLNRPGAARHTRLVIDHLARHARERSQASSR